MSCLPARAPGRGWHLRVRHQASSSHLGSMITALYLIKAGILRSLARKKRPSAC